MARKERVNAESRVQRYSLEALQVHYPYDRGLKALVYAGFTEDGIRDLLESLRFVVPPRGDEIFKRKYHQFVSEAERDTEESGIPPGLVAELGLDPLYTWARQCSSDEESQEWATVNAFMRWAPVLWIQDVVGLNLILGQQPWQIAVTLDRLSLTPDSIHPDKGSLRPCETWCAEDLEFYRDFFWNTGQMTCADWQAYADMALFGSEQGHANSRDHKLRYMTIRYTSLLTNSSRRERENAAYFLAAIVLNDAENAAMTDNAQVWRYAKSPDALSRLRGLNQDRPGGFDKGTRPEPKPDDMATGSEPRPEKARSASIAGRPTSRKRSSSSSGTQTVAPRKTMRRTKPENHDPEMRG